VLRADLDAPLQLGAERLVDEIGRVPEEAGAEAAGEIDRRDATSELFSDAFLIKRPLLQALAPGARTGDTGRDRPEGRR